MPNLYAAAAVQKGFLLPTIVDEVARQEPDHLWGMYPTSTTRFGDGFTSISYAQYANAVNGIAHTLGNALGRARKAVEPLAYLAPNDPRCSLALVAAQKAGYTLFLISDRNSVAATLKLLDEVQCSILVITDSSFPPVRALLSERPGLTVLELASTGHYIHEPYPPYPFEKDLSTARDEPCFIVHTSGSTARGIYFATLNPIFNHSIVILPRPGLPPLGDTILQMLQHAEADIATAAPLTLEGISKNPTLLDDLSQKLEMLIYGGGSLPKLFGDVVASKIKVTTLLGSSEFGPLPTMYRRQYNFEKDWSYIQTHPALGAVFDPLPSGVYELVFKRTPESEPHQTAFTLYPDKTEFRSRDLFSPHPLLPDTWTYASRSDDVIVFLNGEKVNPSEFESHVCQSPEVSAALMFGHQRFEAGVLIELATHGDSTSTPQPLTTEDRAQIVRQLWPTIEAANRILPAYAQVSPGHILFTDLDVPFQRTLKSNVQRQATLDKYADKIEQLYTDIETTWTPVSRPTIKLDSVESFQIVVGESVLEATSIGEIDDDQKFFKLGMDSLQILRLVRQLILKTGLRSIQPNTIYLNPSVSALAQALYILAHNMQSSSSQKQEQQDKIRAETLTRYTQKLDDIAPSWSDHPSSATASIEGESVGNAPVKDEKQRNQVQQVILLTGSTGSIGAYILDALMKSPQVHHVYCVNRSSASHQLQIQRNAAANPASLSSTFPPEKVTFLTADLSEPRGLALAPSVYGRLIDEVTQVIHNTWPVDFNLPLQFFEPQLAGVVNLCEFCARSVRGAQLLFVSSVSATMNFHAVAPSSSSSSLVVPEALIPDIRAPPAVGYAESKYIGEMLLDHAAQVLPLRSPVILRIGQIAGAAHSSGRWNPADWVPALVRGSWYLKALPESLQSSSTTDDEDIDWLPIDTLADIIVEISQRHQGGSFSTSPGQAITITRTTTTKDTAAQRRGDRVRVYHLLNPQRTSWKTLIPSVQRALPGPVEVVPPNVWLAKLRASVNLSMSAKEDKTDNNQTSSGAPIPDSAVNGQPATTTVNGRQVKDAQHQQPLLLQDQPHQNPALPLFDFFESRFGGVGVNGDDDNDTIGQEQGQGNPRFDLRWDTSRAEEASVKLRSAPPVDRSMMERWVRQWFS